MIVVSLGTTWPWVLNGEATPEAATRGAWPVRSNEFERMLECADVVVGVFQNRVVTAYDITDWRWETDEERQAAILQRLSRENPRVVFDVALSERWNGLIGTANPARVFGRWPVQYLDSSSVPPVSR